MIIWILVLIHAVTTPNSIYETKFPEIAQAIDESAHAFPIDNRADAIERTAAQLVAIISFESSFNPDAKGDHGTSIGLGQISISNLPWLSKETGQVWTDKDLHDPTKNIEAAARILRLSHRLCRGRPALHRLAFYASGRGSYSKGVIASQQRLEKANYLLKKYPPFWIDENDL